MRKVKESYSGARVQPVWNGTQTIAVPLIANLALKKGTILGQVSAAAQVEKQQIAISGGPTGGEYSLGFKGDWTDTIAVSATAATIQAALETLPEIGKGNVRVSGTGPFVVDFQGDLTNQPQPLLSTSAALTGGTSPSIAVTRTQAGIANGKWGAYSSSASDGRQVARLVLSLDVTSDAQGKASYGDGATQDTVPAYFQGVFKTTDLNGLDSAAVTTLGRIVVGTAADGILSIR